MSTTPRAWLLTTTGILGPIEISAGEDANRAIRQYLGTDLVGVQSLGPGLDVWHDLRTRLGADVVNLPLAWMADKLLSHEVDGLPRIRGNVVLASHTNGDLTHPTGIGAEGLDALRTVFSDHAQSDCSICANRT